MSLEEALSLAEAKFLFWIHYCNEFNETDDVPPYIRNRKLQQFNDENPDLFCVYNSNGKISGTVFDRRDANLITNTVKVLN